MEPSFRTVVPIPRLSAPISHASRVLCFGSCFAEHIGARLDDYRFKACCNPTGILFNPLSIESAIRRIAGKKRFDGSDLFFHHDQWHGFDHHSAFSGVDQDAVLRGMNERFDGAAGALSHADLLMLTFGTAVVYRHLKRDRVVANCHKLPQTDFERRLVSSSEIASLYRKLIADLLVLHPGLRVILTVSPVRHLRDDPVENSVSKARLIDAVHDLTSECDRIHCFPAYEIMMDELRDYRFYAEDMAHPSGIAIDYIWNRFCDGCIADRSKAFIAGYEPVRRAMQHRIGDPASGRTRAFLTFQRYAIEQLRQKYPEIDLQPAIDYFSGTHG
jgi:hypothetical protein